MTNITMYNTVHFYNLTSLEHIQNSQNNCLQMFHTETLIHLAVNAECTIAVKVK